MPKHNEWGTPQWLFDLLSARYGPFNVDVAASAENSMCGPRYFSVENDGLHADWRQKGVRMWMNPPYDRTLPRWIAKAAAEAARGCLVVGLLPARTCTAAFHHYVLQRPTRLHFIKGRLQYEGELTSRGRRVISPPWGSVVVVWRPGEYYVGGMPATAELAASIDAREQRWISS